MQDTQQKYKFKLGQVVLTRGVNDLVADDIEFSKQIVESFSRYLTHDWGDLGAEDKKSNEDALKFGDRLFARYNTIPRAIYIITEWDRSITTVLFPEEY